MKKRVLIISKNSFEVSTEKVIDWIHYLGHDFYRLNGDIFESEEESILIKSDYDLNLSIENSPISKKYYSMWIRRWSDYDSIEFITKSCIHFKIDPVLILNLTNNIYQDVFAINNAILNLFKCKKYLSKINQLNVNKINVLKIAQINKLKTPEFILTNRKKCLIDFFNKNKIIIKDLSVPFSYKNKETITTSYGELLDAQKIKDLPETFFLSFYQEYIEKEYEIRSFFLNTKFYSMAIFSQKDTKTKVDFRRYNHEKPNRTVPYQLPKDIEKKLIKLMKSLDLQTGSIDMLKSVSGEYYFLEVNPVGQFAMVSYPCNYNLEFEIANYLVS